MKGIFTISLDFELHWGGFEKWPLENHREYFINTRKVIPQMLKLFEQYEVHATWAAVGLLFHDNRQELIANCPELKPSYELKELSAYHFIETHGIGEDETSDPFHYALSLLEKIKATPYQEIGTHTFAHYYCNEQGQTLEQFRADLLAAQKSAARLGITLRSLVFPRNQFNEDYLRICWDCGIQSVRSNPRDWFWNIQSTQNESAWTRFNRGLDAYFPVGKENSYKIQSVAYREGLPVCLPASRLLRPYRPNELFLNEMKIRRINAEMKRAAKANQVYHLWWHPHNFGKYPEQSLKGLEKILKAYRNLRDQYGMQSMTMNELAVEIMNSHAKEKTA